MLVSAFDFALPEELIAQRPPTVRGGSRMLRLDRQTGVWQDRTFAELPELLQPGDLVVLNDTRVLPARLFATRAGLRTQAGSPAPAGTIEVLLLEPLAVGDGENVWRGLVKPAKKVPLGETLVFAGLPGGEPVLRAKVVSAGQGGERILRFFTPANTFAGDPGLSTPANTFAGDPGLSTPANAFAGDPGRVPGESFAAVLERIGHLPLPPYIRRDKAEPNTVEDRERYQTVYSRPFGAGGHREETQVASGNDNQKGEESGGSVAGSAAAPTAGLHFTPELLMALETRGVELARVTLHVGLGTFQPVRVERTEEIRLHAERYSLEAEAAAALNRAWAEGRRIVAVGTTTTRTLEHAARVFEARYGALGAENPLRLEPHSGSTGLFLSPGPEGDDRFRLVSGLLTNFHLPQSTLLMLVSAFAGRERVLAAYGHAVKAGYRFFSYGDCMLVV